MIKDFIKYQEQVRGLSPRTCHEYEKELHAFASWARMYGLRWSKIQKQDIDRHTAWMHERGLKAPTIKKRVCALRALYRWALHEGMMSENPARWCQTPRIGERLPKSASITGIDAYLKTKAGTQKEAKMHVAVALLVETGMRLGELMNVRTCDFNKENKSLRVTGKGNKERIVYYGRRSAQALNMYERNTRGHLFDGWTDEGLRWEMYRQLGKFCPRVHPHQLRHTFATEMLNQGMDLKTLSVLLGHSSVMTTEIYARAAEKRIAEQYQTFKF